MTLVSTNGNNLLWLDVSIYYQRLRSTLDDVFDDAFKPHRTATMLLPAVLEHMFDWRKPTPYSLVNKLYLDKPEHAEVMSTINVYLEFLQSNAIHEIQPDWTYTGTSLKEESLHLAIIFESRKLQDFSLEHYIEHCQRSGEYLHSDFERVLREFRSLGNDTDRGNPIPLLRPRRIGSKTW